MDNFQNAYLTLHTRISARWQQKIKNNTSIIKFAHRQSKNISFLKISPLLCIIHLSNGSTIFTHSVLVNWHEQGHESFYRPKAIDLHFPVEEKRLKTVIVHLIVCYVPPGLNIYALRTFTSVLSSSTLQKKYCCYTLTGGKKNPDVVFFLGRQVIIVGLQTNFIGCSSRGSQQSDSDWWNVANNIAALANCQKLLLFPNSRMSSMYEKWRRLVINYMLCKITRIWLLQAMQLIRNCTAETSPKPCNSHCLVNFWNAKLVITHDWMIRKFIVLTTNQIQN